MNNRKLQPIRRSSELMDYSSNSDIVKLNKSDKTRLSTSSISNNFDIDYNNRDTATSPDSNRPEKSSLASGESRPQSPVYTLGPKKRLLGNYNQLESYPNHLTKTPSPTNNSDSGDTISTTTSQQLEHKAAIKAVAPSLPPNNNNTAALLTMGLNSLLNHHSHRFHPSLAAASSSSSAAAAAAAAAAQHHYQSFMNSHHSANSFPTSHNQQQQQQQQQFNHGAYNPTSLLQHPHSRLLLPAHLIHLQALSQQGGINNNNSPYRLHQDYNNNSFRNSSTASNCLETNDDDQQQGSPNSESNNNNNTSVDDVEEIDDETGTGHGANSDELDESDDHMMSGETDTASAAAAATAVMIMSGLDSKLKSNNQLLYEMNMKSTFKSPMRGKSKFKRADCWNYFVTKFCKKTNLYFDHCTIQKNGQVCGSKFVHHGATTRLNKHLIQKHKIKLVIVNKNNDNFGNEDELAVAAAAAAAASAAAGSMTGGSTASATNVSPSSLANNMPSLNYLKQLSPIGLSSPNENINSSLTASLSSNGLRMFGDSTSTGVVANILSSQGINGGIMPMTTANNPVDTDLNMLLISFILSSSTSIELIDNKWFRMFVQNLNSSYKLPTRQELGGLFKKLYQEKSGGSCATSGLVNSTGSMNHHNNSNSSNNSAGSPNPSMTSNGSVKD